MFIRVLEDLGTKKKAQKRREDRGKGEIVIKYNNKVFMQSYILVESF